jgi:hypothetical protein
VIGGKGRPHINAVVDSINLVWVENRFSIGLYGLVNLKGDIVFRDVAVLRNLFIAVSAYHLCGGCLALVWLHPFDTTHSYTRYSKRS